MSLKQTRAKNIRIRIVDPVLTQIEKFATIVGMDLEDYLVGCGLEYPALIAQLELIKQEKNNGATEVVSGGAEDTGSGQA